mmetsp:Transcript_82208/g.137418  ORF Transcript_82208/g.137418 Transcript_82208/m.137418 type:complete len:85 (-) Transcript_82208:1108-1362(-)
MLRTEYEYELDCPPPSTGFCCHDSESVPRGTSTAPMRVTCFQISVLILRVASESGHLTFYGHVREVLAGGTQCCNAAWKDQMLV